MLGPVCRAKHSIAFEGPPVGAKLAGRKSAGISEALFVASHKKGLLHVRGPSWLIMDNDRHDQLTRRGEGRISGFRGGAEQLKFFFVAI